MTLHDLRIHLRQSAGENLEGIFCVVQQGRKPSGGDCESSERTKPTHSPLINPAILRLSQKQTTDCIILQHSVVQSNAILKS